MKSFAAASISILLAAGGLIGTPNHHEPLADDALRSLWDESRQSSLMNHNNNHHHRRPDQNRQKLNTLHSEMTLREKIGQMLMLDVRKWSQSTTGTPANVEVLPPALAKVINEYAIGSIILFRENLINTSQTYRLTTDVQDARANLPIIIGTDQEGGLVTRLRVGTEMPGNMAVAATRNTSMAYGTGVVHGSELSALGFNLNFAPDVDVNVNQNNPVIGVRSFSSNPALVGEMGVAYINGLQANNVTATIKHFPGHGNVDTDSHIGLPVVPYSAAEWRANDLPPFQHAIDRGVKAIMTAHIVVPALDDTQVLSKKAGVGMIGLPATLSRKILTGILREELNYSGIIMTDAMEMAAIAENFGANEAVKEAFLAGVDIAMMPVGVRNPNDIAKLADLYAFLEKACETDPILLKRIEESSRRVVTFKIDNKLVPRPIDTEAHAETVVASKAHKEYEREVAEAGITLIVNDAQQSAAANVLPFVLQSAHSNNVLVISDEPARNIIISRELSAIAGEAAVNITVMDAVIKTASTTTPIPQTLLRQISASPADGGADFIVLLTYNLKQSQNPSAAQLIVDAANAANNKPLVVISSLNPYDICAFKKGSVHANIAIYGITGFDITNALRNLLECNIKAGIRSIFTAASPSSQQQEDSAVFNKPTGKLPVDIRDLADGGAIMYPFGHGLQY